MIEQRAPTGRPSGARPALRWAKRALLLAAGAIIALPAGAAPAGPPAAPAMTVLNDVTVVDTHDGKLSPHMAVVVASGRISRIVPARALDRRGMTVIDAHGKFLVPGYNDMHAHPLNYPGAERLDDLTLMLANGITGFRQMSGSPELLKARRDGTLMPAGPAIPELLAMPGDVLIAPVTPTPAAGIAVVDQQKAAGADFIKVVDVSPPAFFAIVGEAKKVGLPVMGHLPNGVDVLQAAQAGYRAVEHLGPFANILIDCSTDQAGIQQAIAARKPPPVPPMTPAMALQRLQVAATEPLLLVASDPSAFDFLQHIVDTYSDAKCRALSRQLTAAGMWQSPTLIRVKTIDFGDDPAFVNDPNLRYVTSARRAMWAMVGHQVTTTVTPEQKQVMVRFWQLQLKMLKMFDETGTHMLAGTDVGGQWDISGFSLHQDFDLLAQDGLSPLTVLQMTTLNAAVFLGREATMGSVAVGGNADLVLLDANPVASAQNLHKIAGVMRAGTWFTAQQLGEMKEGVARRNAAPLN